MSKVALQVAHKAVASPQFVWAKYISFYNIITIYNEPLVAHIDVATHTKVVIYRDGAGANCPHQDLALQLHEKFTCAEYISFSTIVTNYDEPLVEDITHPNVARCITTAQDRAWSHTKPDPSQVVSSKIYTAEKNFTLTLVQQLPSR